VVVEVEEGVDEVAEEVFEKGTILGMCAAAEWIHITPRGLLAQTMHWGKPFTVLLQKAGTLLCTMFALAI